MTAGTGTTDSGRIANADAARMTAAGHRAPTFGADSMNGEAREAPRASKTGADLTTVAGRTTVALLQGHSLRLPSISSRLRNADRLPSSPSPRLRSTDRLPSSPSPRFSSADRLPRHRPLSTMHPITGTGGVTVATSVVTRMTSPETGGNSRNAGKPAHIHAKKAASEAKLRQLFLCFLSHKSPICDSEPGLSGEESSVSVVKSCRSRDNG
jgi:hypothetical protein